MTETLSLTHRSGVAFVICAPSGTGKTTLIHRLRTEFPHFGFSVSCTTRSPRPGEVDGSDYYFISREEFLNKRNSGYFAEWAMVHGHYYGTPLSPVREMLSSGRDMLFDIDVQGAAQLRLTLQYGRYVFLLPPSMSELKYRIQERGVDSPEDISLRLANAEQEIRQWHWFDTVIVNDDLDIAYDHLRAAYLTATLAPALRPCLATSILER